MLSWGKNRVFQDSIQFLNSSLNNLVKSLEKLRTKNFNNLLLIVPQKCNGAENSLTNFETEGSFAMTFEIAFNAIFIA